MQNLLGTLREPIGFGERIQNLGNSMMLLLLCECCLQPQFQRNFPQNSITKQQSRSFSFLRNEDIGGQQKKSSISRQGSNSAFGQQQSAIRRLNSSSRLFSSTTESFTLSSCWPIKINSPKTLVPLLPLVLVSFHAAIAVNGHLHLGRLFGFSNHIIADDMLPIVQDFVRTLGSVPSEKDYQEMEERVTNSKPKGLQKNYCIEQFRQLLLREDPENQWTNFLSKR